MQKVIRFIICRKVIIQIRLINIVQMKNILITALLITLYACGGSNEHEKQENEISEWASSLYKSFMYTDTLSYKYKFKDINNYGGGGFVLAIKNSIADSIIEPGFKTGNNRRIMLIDSLNEEVQRVMMKKGGNVPYEPLGTEYDYKYWDEEDLMYITEGGFSYIANRLFDIREDIKLISLAKYEHDDYKRDHKDKIPFSNKIVSNLIFMTVNKWTAEPIDRIEIDFQGLYKGLENNTASLRIEKDAIYSTIDGKETNYKITKEGKFEEMK